MEQAPTCHSDAPADEPVAHNFKAKKRYKHRASHKATMPQLMTRDQLDQRRGAVQVFDRCAREIQNDLGGRDQLSAIELALVEAFVGANFTMQTLNAKLMLGEEIDHGLHALVAGAMVRIASRLGLQRRPRDVSPSLSQYLASKEVEA